MTDLVSERLTYSHGSPFSTPLSSTRVTVARRRPALAYAKIRLRNT